MAFASARSGPAESLWVVLALEVEDGPRCQHVCQVAHKGQGEVGAR